MPRGITSVAVDSTTLAPLEEYESVEAWLLALPGSTVLNIGMDDGSSYLTSVAHILDSSLLGEVVSRFRIQRRLGELRRPRR